MTVCRSDQERKHLIGQRRPDYSMEYYSPEYFLEPAVARTLHKPLLSSITIFSSNDVIQVSTAPLQEIQNPSQAQPCTPVHCSTSPAATTQCINQASTNISEQVPTLFPSGIIEKLTEAT